MKSKFNEQKINVYCNNCGHRGWVEITKHKNIENQLKNIACNNCGLFDYIFIYKK